MKKIVSIALCLLLLVGCTTTPTDNASSTPAPAESSASQSNTTTDSSVAESTAEVVTSSEEVSQTETDATTTYQSDILIVGGGGAGLVAALSAAEEGKTVMLLEKMAVYGGATSMSSGKIPAAVTKEQKEAGYEDSVEALMRDINRAGGYTQNQELLRVAVENATPIKEWLEAQGVEWELETSSIYYGQSTYRIHVAKGSGANLVKILVDKVEANPNIISLKNMPVQGLTTENGKVTGAFVEKEGKKINFTADKVILATSGFGANKEMIARYTPSIKNAVPNVAPGATGEGIIWGVELGADVAAMNAYQAYAPISFASHKSLGSGFLDNGGILVNTDGHRFINEYVGYSPLGTAITNQPESAAFMIWDKNIQALDLPQLKAFGEGELKEAATVEELATALGVDGAVLKSEFEKYQAGIEKGEDYLNRTKLPKAFEAPFYGVKITADYRHTQGGLVIEPTTAKVLKEDLQPIENLYAAGGVTEGFSSKADANYMAGNGLLQAFVYGRIAGQTAAKDDAEAMKTDDFTKQKEELTTLSNAAPSVTISEVTYKDGAYEGVGKGRNGDIKVKVTVAGGKVSTVEVLEQTETEGFREPAIDTLPGVIVKANGIENVEAVSGATLTSKGIIEAVQKALDQAK